MNWAILCLIGGAMDGLGQLLCKNAWRPPPYVIVGMLGVMWFLCPIILISVGHIGPFTAITWSQVLQLGPSTILLALGVGLMFWADNLTRFDANNKAPFVGFVLILVEISAALTAFLIEIASGKTAETNLFQILGVVLALLSMACFWLKKLADEKASRAENPDTGNRPRYEAFLPVNWVILAVLTGVFSGLGGIVYKDVSTTMPPEVFTGFIGFMWIIATLVLMSGRKTWSNMGLRLKILSFQEARAYGFVVFGSLILAGVLTWAANLGRFGAVKNAPYVGYVYLLFPIAAGSLTLLLEYWNQRLRYGKSVDARPLIGRYGWAGVIFATASLAFFTL